MALHLGQVGGQVVDEPSVAGDEGLWLGGLGLPHDAEPVLVGLEGHDPVVTDPELLPAAREVDVLGRVDSGRGQERTLRGVAPVECAIDGWS